MNENNISSTSLRKSPPVDNVQAIDIVYADPPYLGRHVDYFNSWSDRDESELVKKLSQLSCKFILSTWHSNEFRTNQTIEKHWTSDTFHILTKIHHYHVGATEELRHPMLEALITNFPYSLHLEKPESQQSSLLTGQ